MKQITAVQQGDHRIEYLAPDYGGAYAAIAPLVSEAFAFLKCERIEDAMKSLESARAVIEVASMMVCMIESDANPKKEIE